MKDAKVWLSWYLRAAGNSSLFAVAHWPAVISGPKTPGPADTGPEREQWTAHPS